MHLHLMCLDVIKCWESCTWHTAYKGSVVSVLSGVLRQGGWTFVNCYLSSCYHMNCIVGAVYTPFTC